MVFFCSLRVLRVFIVNIAVFTDHSFVATVVALGALAQRELQHLPDLLERLRELLSRHILWHKVDIESAVVL